MRPVKGIGCLEAQRLGSLSLEAIHHLARWISSSLSRGNAPYWTTHQMLYPASVDGLVLAFVTVSIAYFSFVCFSLQTSW